MSDIPHIAYTGESKVIRRLCAAVNALTDWGGGSEDITAAVQTLQAQVAAILATIPLTASVENNTLILTGAGAAVKESRLILASDAVSVSNGVLSFS